MSSKQSPNQFSLKLSSSAGPVQRPAEYSMEWGAYGLSPAKQAFNEAGYNSSVFDFRPAPPVDARPEPSQDRSCLDVGVMFDVCPPKDLADPQRTAGDFADVVPLHGDWVALFLGDACGQGAAAALAVPQALYALRQLLNAATGISGSHPSDCHRDPAYTLKRLNRYLCSPALPAACASVSLSLALLNTKTGETRCACAGSEPPLILRANGQIETVSAGRMALGVEVGKEYRSVDFRLGKGDVLLLATDGITKARKANCGESGTSLRYEGLAELALKAFHGGGSPRRMARTVLSGAREFAGGTFHDHASVLVAAQQ